MGHRSPLSAILLLLALGGAVFWWSWKPSSTGIAEKMAVDAEGKVTFEERIYSTEWGETEEIRGHLRIKERHYDENMPILTWTFLVTTGEYTDPAIVSLSTDGHGNFQWRADRQPKGSLIGYHLVPASPAAEKSLRAIDEGNEIFLEGKLSKTSRLESDRGAFVQLTHSNHKFVLLEAAGIVE